MVEGFLVTVASDLGYRTYTDMSKASQYIELLTMIEENCVITIRHGNCTEERAVVHGVSRSYLATERVEVDVVEDSGVAPVFVCRMLRIEAPLDEDFICSVCEGEDWISAILEAGANVRRLRTCLTCGYQLTTRELPKMDVDDTDADGGECAIGREENGISDRAREILSAGATDNPAEEMTVSFFTEGNEAIAYRIFRRRHTGGDDPMEVAERWVRQIRGLCAASRGELKTTTVRTDADGGSVLVAISGQGIVAKEEAGHFS